MHDQDSESTRPMTFEHLEKINNCRHLLFEPAPRVVGELIEEIKKLKTQNQNLFYALELIEEAFVDGDDTYKAWLEMGRIAKNALEQHQYENK